MISGRSITRYFWAGVLPWVGTCSKIDSILVANSSRARSRRKLIIAQVYIEKSHIRSRQKNLSTRFSFTSKNATTRTQGTQTNTDRLSVFGLEVNYDSVDTFHPFRPLIRLISKSTSENFGGGLNFATISIR